jgi:FixJ family two-component response regulator
MESLSVVYVIDDDASVRKSLERLIRSAGLAAKTFSSARDFLSCTLPDHPGCLLLDIEMPEMTGLELQEQLAALHRSLPIIFITGFGNVPKSVQAMKAGAVDFLEKPFEAETLLEAIHRAINHDIQNRQINGELFAIKKHSKSLTNREREVFELVVTGMLNKQIAFQLGITEATIKLHRARIMQKMGAQSLADLVRLAERLK